MRSLKHLPILLLWYWWLSECHWSLFTSYWLCGKCTTLFSGLLLLKSIDLLNRHFLWWLLLYWWLSEILLFMLTICKIEILARGSRIFLVKLEVEIILSNQFINCLGCLSIHISQSHITWSFLMIKLKAILIWWDILLQIGAKSIICL